MATKNLTFKRCFSPILVAIDAHRSPPSSFNLGENVQLMLSFVPPGPGLFVDKIPIAWK